ncbi:MAG: transposase [Planctomycetota bacterium]|nr:transposase [Planctomycetota bacterium]
MRISIRADASFAVSEVYIGCETLRLEYTIGLGMNSVLKRRSETLLEKALKDFTEKAEPQRQFDAFEYQTATWSELRGVVLNAEVIRLVALHADDEKLDVREAAGFDTLTQVFDVVHWSPPRLLGGTTILHDVRETAGTLPHRAGYPLGAVEQRIRSSGVRDSNYRFHRASSAGAFPRPRHNFKDAGRGRVGPATHTRCARAPSQGVSPSLADSDDTQQG